MKRLAVTLRGLRGCSVGSVPLQYAIVAAGTALVTMMIVQAAAGRVVDKLDAVTSALSKIRF